MVPSLNRSRERSSWVIVPHTGLNCINAWWAGFLVFCFVLIGIEAKMYNLKFPISLLQCEHNEFVFG